MVPLNNGRSEIDPLSQLLKNVVVIIFTNGYIGRNKQGLKRTLFNETRQCNMQDKNMFIK